MPVHRVTSFYGQANMGWSETWWHNHATLAGTISALATMLDYRNTLLTGIHSLIACRVAVEGQTSRGQLLLPGRQTISGGTNLITIPDRGDYPEGTSTLRYDQVRANLQNQYMVQGRRISTRYMVGIPDVSSLTESATLNTTDPAQWWIYYNGYHAHLQMAGWTIKCLVRGAENPERRIRRWVTRGTPPDVVGVVIGGENVFTPEIGSKVQVKAVRMTNDGIRTPNKQWVVEEVTTQSEEGTRTIYLRGSEAVDPSTIRIMGTIRPVLYEYVAFDQVRPMRMGIHKRGKPFNSPAGRTKTKRYAA